MDTTGFNSHIPPETELKKEMQESQKSYAEQFIESFTWDSDWLRVGMSLPELWKAFSDWMDENGFERKYMGRPGVAFGKKIAKHVRVEKKKVRGKTIGKYFPISVELPKTPEEPQ
jgi:hypothetical protein